MSARDTPWQLVLVSSLLLMGPPNPGALAQQAGTVTTIGASQPPAPARTYDVPFQRLLDPNLLARVEPFPFLPGEDADRSVSVGTVTEGRLFNAAAIESPSPHLGVLPRQAERDLRYGSEQLIGLITRVARRLGEGDPDSVLWLGNVARRAGGDIPYSVSHNSGRDADLAFFYLDVAGDPITPPDLLPVDDALQAVHEGVTYLFDVPRNWQLVEALLTDDGAQIQFLFVSNGLKQAMLDHARSAGASADLVRRAETVMTQPGRRNPHNDHLHVRLYCSRTDVARGCRNIGREHPWVDTFSGERRRAIRALRDAISMPSDDVDNASERAAAIERLAILRATDEASRIAGELGDESAAVRAAAARALGELRAAGHTDALVARLSGESDPTVLVALTWSLARIGTRAEVCRLAETLAARREVSIGGRRLDARALVVDTLGAVGCVDALPALVDLMSSSDAYLRSRAQWAAARLEAHQTILDSLTNEEQPDPTPSALAAALATAPPAVSFTLQRMLMDRLERESHSLTWPRADAAWYWQNLAPD